MERRRATHRISVKRVQRKSFIGEKYGRWGVFSDEFPHYDARRHASTIPVREIKWFLLLGAIISEYYIYFTSSC